MSARALATASSRSPCSLGRLITCHRPSSLRQVCSVKPCRVLITSTQYIPSREWMLSMTFSVLSPSVISSILASITRSFKLAWTTRTAPSHLRSARRRSMRAIDAGIAGPQKQVTGPRTTACRAVDQRALPASICCLERLRRDWLTHHHQAARVAAHHTMAPYRICPDH